jgi:hypothetical protein
MRMMVKKIKGEKKPPVFATPLLKGKKIEVK